MNTFGELGFFFFISRINTDATISYGTSRVKNYYHAMGHYIRVSKNGI
jgi:hypothetical protein